MKRSTSRTKIAAALTVGALAMSLAACSSDNDNDNGNDSDTSNGANADEEIPVGGVDDGTEITMWTRAPLERQAINAVEAYNASHENQVNLEILPNDDVEGKVGASAQTNSLPDVLAGDVVRIPYWTEQGIFREMTSEIEAIADVDSLQQGHIDAGNFDGALHTLPFVTDISVMVWNKDLYEEAGLDPEVGPSNLAEFVEQAKAVAALDKTGVAGTYVAGQSGGALAFKNFPIIWASGEKVLSADGTEAMLNTDVAKEVLGAFRELADTPQGIGAGSKEETGATWTAPFAEGNIGVMPYPYTAVTGMFEDNAFEVGVAPIPGIEGNSSTFLGGDAIGISRDSENVAQAWNFISWLMSAEAQQEVFADNNDTASHLDVLESGYADADPRTHIANSTIADGRAPVAVYFNEAFNAAGSPWQLLIQDAIWADGAEIDTHNDAITAILSQ